MKINFNQLQELMKPLSDLCKAEKVVDLSGTKVTIKILSPIEETDVQKLLPDMDDGVSALEFADIFRRETLARAIVAINDMDLRGVSSIETEETLPNGLPVKMSKTDAILKILEGWSRPVLAKVFEQYGVLSEEIENNLDESLKLNLEDREAEKANLNQRLQEIEKAETLEKLSTPQDESEDNGSEEVL